MNLLIEECTNRTNISNFNLLSKAKNGSFEKVHIIRKLLMRHCLSTNATFPGFYGINLRGPMFLNGLLRFWVDLYNVKFKCKFLNLILKVR